MTAAHLQVFWSWLCPQPTYRVSRLLCVSTCWRCRWTPQVTQHPVLVAPGPAKAAGAAPAPDMTSGAMTGMHTTHRLQANPCAAGLPKERVTWALVTMHIVHHSVASAFACWNLHQCGPQACQEHDVCGHAPLRGLLSIVSRHYRHMLAVFQGMLWGCSRAGSARQGRQGTSSRPSTATSSVRKQDKQHTLATAQLQPHTDAEAWLRHGLYLAQHGQFAPAKAS